MLRKAHLSLVLGTTLACFAGCSTVDPITECGADAGNPDAECFEGYACDVADTRQCLPSCQNDRDCVGSKTCQTLPGNTGGLCRIGTAPAGDTGPGDPGPGDPGPGDPGPGDPGAGDTNAGD